MSAFFKVFSRESRKLLHSPGRLFWVLGVPLLLFAFLSYLFSNEVVHNNAVVVCDYDQSHTSRDFLRKLEAAPAIRITHSVGSLAEAQVCLQRAEAYAAIIVPTDFEKMIEKGQSAQAICYLNTQYLLPSNFIYKDFMKTVIAFSADIATHRRMKAGALPRQALGAVEKIHLDAHTLFNPYTNYNYYLNLSLFPMMFHILVMMFTAYIVGLVLKRERGLFLYELGEGNALAIVAGKLLPYTLVFIFVAWLMDVYFFKFLDIPFKGTFIEAFVLTTFFVLAAQFAGFLISAFAPNLRSAVTFGGGFAAIAFSFSGYTFPLDSMPPLMQVVAQFFPFTHYMLSYIDIAIKGHDLTWVLPHLLALMGYVLLGFLALPQYMKRLQNNKYASI